MIKIAKVFVDKRFSRRKTKPVVDNSIMGMAVTGERQGLKIVVGSDNDETKPVTVRIYLHAFEVARIIEFWDRQL